MKKLLEKLNKGRAATDKATTGVDNTNKSASQYLRDIRTGKNNGSNNNSAGIWKQGKGGS